MWINHCKEKRDFRRPDCYPLKGLLIRLNLDWHLETLIWGGVPSSAELLRVAHYVCTNIVVYTEHTCFPPGSLEH